MNNQGSKHGGAYLQAPSQRKCYSKFAFLVGVFMVIIASILFVLLKSEATEDRIVYHLPDEAPVINLPETLEDNSDSRNLDDLVDPHFKFIIETGNHSIDVSLPILKAPYKHRKNEFINLDTLLLEVHELKTIELHMNA